MDLSHLSEKEREAILQVLQRDEELRKRDEQKLHHLKNELHFLRKRGALRGDLDPESSCSRCRVELGRMLNRGATCVSCQSRVCKSCRVYDPTADEQWVCVVCHKQMEIQAASGEWMNEFIRRPSRKRDNKVFVPPSDVIKHSICRSWTSADGFARDIDTSGAVKETRHSRHVTPNETPRHPPSTSQKMMNQSRAQSQKIPPAIIHVPQPSITAPARPATRKQRPVTSPEEPVVVVAESSPKPVRQLPNPTPRASRILPTPPVPRQRSPRGLKVSESERSESQDSGYVTSQVTVSPGIETRDSPRVLRKSSVDERSTVIARDVSPSASDASDGEEEERGVVFRKVMVRKKRESGIRKTSSVFDCTHCPPSHCCHVSPPPPPSWGANSLPRTKPRTVHSFYQYSSSSSSYLSDTMSRKELQSFNPFSAVGGSLTLPRTGRFDGDVTNTCVDGAVVLRSVDSGHRKTPTGSPVVKRIRRSQREGGGRLRSPDRFFGKENVPCNGGDDVVDDLSEFVDDVSACLEFEEDLVQVNKSFDDVLLDKMIPEGDDYKLVFISSSSSKSSGQNSSNTSNTSSPRVSLLDDDEVILFIDDELDDVGGAIRGGEIMSTNVSNDVDVKVDENTATIVEVIPSVASYQEIVESFSPTHSVDEVETVDHVIDKNNSRLVNILRVESPCGAYSNNSTCRQMSTTGQIVNRYFVKSEESSGEKSVDEVSVTNHSFLPQIDDVSIEKTEDVTSSRVLLHLSGWVDEDLCNPHMNFENMRRSNESTITNDVTSAISFGGAGDMSRSWEFCKADAEDVEVQSVHCTVDDDTMSFSEDGLSCQSTPDVDVDVCGISQLFTSCSDSKNEEENFVAENVNNSDKIDDNDNCDISLSELFVDDVDVVVEKVADDDKEVEENLQEKLTLTDEDDVFVDGEEVNESNTEQTSNDVISNDDNNLQTQTVDDEDSTSANNNTNVSADSHYSSSPREDRLESDSDSQDTVIEGESYKRIRQLAIQHKILEANESISNQDESLTSQEVEDLRSIDEFKEENTDENKLVENVNEMVMDTNVVESKEEVTQVANECEREIVELELNLTKMFYPEDDESSAPLVDPVDLFADELVKDILEQALPLVLVTKSSQELMMKVTGHSEEIAVVVGDEDKLSMSTENGEKSPTPSDSDWENEGKESGSRKSILEKYFTQSLGKDLSEENAEDNASSLETSSEVPSETTTDQWDSDHTEKLDESIEDSDTTFSDSASSDEANFDREEELRGFSRAIDFSLHTIIEESCEESETERSKRKSQSPPAQRDPSDLEKYFSFTIGDSLLSLNAKRRSLAEESETSDSYSETSGSICSEGIDKIDEDIDPAVLASSRLEKYFMTGFLGIDQYVPFDENPLTDESGSEGVGSPNIRRKSSVKSKVLVSRDSVGSEMSSTSQDLPDGSARSSSLSEEDETPFEKSEGCDTIKRKKKSSLSVMKEVIPDVDEKDIDKGEDIAKDVDSSNCGVKESDLTPLPDSIVVDKNKPTIGLDRKQQSRDSGFIGSSDDLLKDSNDDIGAAFVDITEPDVDKTCQDPTKKRITREGSNSDDETRYIVGQLMDQITKGFSVRINSSPLLPRAKPPELEMFEAELTKLMQIVPGIDATVKEIVEELSSTDYYSDSYESSDYNSSEHEGSNKLGIGLLRRSLRSSLRSNEELRLHCANLIPPQEVIANKDTEGDLAVGESEEGLREDANSPFTRETIYIYEKLMSSLGRMAEQASKENSDTEHPGNQSPLSTRSQKSTTLQAVQHIRDRLTSLMREVQASSESSMSMSARVRRNNSSSSSSSWMGSRVEPRPVFQSTDVSTRPYGGNLHADITRWLAKQPFHSGDEQSVSSTSSTNYESDSPTDTEMSVESDDVASPALYKRTKESKSKSTLSKLERSGSEITIVDDDLSFRSLDTPETLFATHEIGEESNKSKTERFPADACLRGLKSLPERGVLDLQYFVTQGTNNEYEVWQSLVVDEEKFKADNIGKHEEVRPLRARNLLGSLKSSSSDTLQCISEEDLDSKPSSTRTSMLGSSTNICSSQSSLIDFKRGSFETLERSTQSPCHSPADVDQNVGKVVLRKNAGVVTVDVPLTTERRQRQDYRASLHAEVLETGEIAHAKDKVDFRSSLHLWMENKTKPATRAMSADPLPQDYLFNTPNPLIPKNATTSRENLAVRPKISAFNLSDNQLDRQNRQPPAVQYSTMTKSGPIGLLPEEPPSASRKASTLPRIGCDLSANVSFLHKNSTDNFLTNAPPLIAGPQTQPRWSRSGQGPDGNARREVRSWSAEDNPASPDEKPSPTKPTKTMPKTSAVAVPQISVSDIQDMGSSVQSNPSGRSSLGSQNNSDRESAPDEDIDRLVALHKTRSSLSSLGNRSDSMTSVYSAAGGGRYGTVVVRGEVLFGLNYNFKLGALEISIKNCRDLAPVDTKRNRSDPYVKVYLLPDKSKSGKRKTKVRKHTLNPTFDEVLRFFVTISELETRTLWLTVWHSDMFGRNDFLGEVTLPLGYGVFEDDSSPQWYRLQERLGPPEEVMTYKGELIIALKYVPPDVTTQKKGKQGKGSLHVLVKEARNLTAVRSNGTSDPFCKCYLLPDKSKGSKQKTPVVKKNCNPRWNHTFVHDDVSQEDLRDRCLELTVWDYDRLTSNDFLGGVRLSLGLGRYQGKEVDWLDSSGDEIALWQSMLDKPNVWIDGYVFLQPSMEKRPI